MLYAIIFSSIVFYLAMAHVTYKYTHRIKRAWFGDNFNTDSDVWMSLGWPITLPAFYHVFYDAIKRVNKGEDWADVNVNDYMRDSFRKEFMRKEIV